MGSRVLTPPRSDPTPVGVPGHRQPLKHVGLYVYRVDFLLQYAAMPPSALETTEMLEQLRVLDAGYRIAVAVRSVTTTGIDTPEQYEDFVRRWAERGAD